MWISWWTDPLRKVVYGSYDSAPAPILGRSELSVPSGKRLLFSIRRHAHPCRSGPCRRRRDRCRESLPPIRPHPMSPTSFVSATRESARWPEIYDDMCLVASRREFNGWGYDQLATQGVTFTLGEMSLLPRGSGRSSRPVPSRRSTAAWRRCPPDRWPPRAGGHGPEETRSAVPRNRETPVPEVIHNRARRASRCPQFGGLKAAPSRCGASPSRARPCAP